MHWELGENAIKDRHMLKRQKATTFYKISERSKNLVVKGEWVIQAFRSGSEIKVLTIVLLSHLLKRSLKWEVNENAFVLSVRMTKSFLSILPKALPLYVPILFPLSSVQIYAHRFLYTASLGTSILPLDEKPFPQHSMANGHTGVLRLDSKIKVLTRVSTVDRHVKEHYLICIAWEPAWWCVKLLLQSTFISMCCHTYNWNMVDCNVRWQLNKLKDMNISSSDMGFIIETL